MRTVLLFSLLSLPAIPVHAETTWLLVHLCPGNASCTLEKIEMSGIDQCNEEAERLMGSPTIFPKDVRRKGFGFDCIKGK